MTPVFVFDAYGTLFDLGSLKARTDAFRLGYGDYINALWRMKQLEYTWLRSIMGTFVDFERITFDALEYAVRTIDVQVPKHVLQSVAAGYEELRPYDDTLSMLTSLSHHRLAILSNGSQDMLDRLVVNAGLQSRFEAVISVEAKRTYKPDPRAYELVEERLNVTRHDVIFVSANGFDIAGAKNFGFKIARVNRVTPQRLAQALVTASAINFGPEAIFAAMRTQEEALGSEADFTVSNLSELVQLAAPIKSVSA